MTSNETIVETFAVTREFAGPGGKFVLHPCNLHVSKGEFIAFCGPSGSGKTTLMSILGLLEDPDSGTYKLAGVKVGDLGDNEKAALRATRIGFVFQAFHLINHCNAIDNVAMGLAYRGVRRQVRRSRAKETLVRLGLEHRLYAMPATMSGGERQRVAIARALVGEPTLLLCDEPTGNLDSGNAAVVLDYLATLPPLGVTVIMVTHDQSIAVAADRIVSIADGYVQDG